MLSETTYVGLVRSRSEYNANDRAFTFLGDSLTDRVDHLSYEALDSRVRAVAAALQQCSVPGDRAVLLYKPSLDYIIGIIGCMYAGVVAVPVFAPRRIDALDQIRHVAGNSGAKIVLTTTYFVDLLKAMKMDQILPGTHWLATDVVDISEADKWREPEVNPDTLALLQYTSGSTSQPKGVMLAHRHLLANARMIQEKANLGRESKGVSWLPPYHDMGLIGAVLQPLYSGFPVILMSPESFVKSPLRWLETISTERATISPAPNFAYDLCVNKITPEQRQQLDLSSWRVALNGAEPVRAETLRRFSEFFSSAGFRAEAFFPAYGLAESTLLVAGPDREGARIYSVSETALESGRLELAAGAGGAKKVVSCGSAADGVDICIVDQNGRTRKGETYIGEVWVRSDAVAYGYWENADATEATFGARIDAENSTARYLRSGDLGGFMNGQLFVTGRIKDLIVIRGRNLYPQDIELTVATSHPALRPGGGAAFSITAGDGEQLVVVHEIDRKAVASANFQTIEAAIRSAVARNHDIQINKLVLISQGGTPKTSSGKVQRSKCRELWEARKLETLFESASAYTAESVALDAAGRRGASEAELLATQIRLRRKIERSILTWIADRSDLDVQKIDRHASFGDFAIDSIGVIELACHLEGLTNTKIPADAVFRYKTIASFSEFLSFAASKTDDVQSKTTNGSSHSQTVVASKGFVVPTFSRRS